MVVPEVEKLPHLKQLGEGQLVEISRELAVLASNGPADEVQWRGALARLEEVLDPGKAG